MTRSAPHDSTEGPVSVPAWPFAAAAVLLFAGISYAVLRWGHPHEDAYILFIYSEQFAGTGRIAYFDGGPPTEGATDFLWMVAIAGLVWAGLSPAIAALALNTAGVGLSAWLIARTILRHRGSAVIAAVGAALAAFALGMQAGYGGFSAPLYGALCLLLFLQVWRGGERGLLAVPLTALLVALFRPDGVVIGAAATLAALTLVPRDRAGRFLGVMASAGAAGCIYFLWRMSYFGEVLPLPLIVKGQSAALLPGLPDILSWAGRAAIPLVLSGIALGRGLAGRRLWLALLPFALHLVFLAFAVPSQNVAFRFEAPQTLVALGLATLAVARLSLHPRALLRLGSLAALLMFAGNEARLAFLEVRYLTNRDYINFLPQYLAPGIPPGTTIALTEAGRMAYWVGGRKVDLVGLNTAATARNGADARLIGELSPDLIFFHVDGSARLGCGGAPFCEISVEELLASRVDDRPPEDVVDRVRRAPLAVYAYLKDHPERYAVFAALYGRGHYHVFAVARSGTLDLEAFRSALEKSFGAGSQPGYLESYRLLRTQKE